MPRDGSGNYSAPAGQPVQTGTTISSTIFNNLVADLVAAMTASIARNGETTPTANLPMGGFKHTGVADGTARNHYSTVGQNQDDAASVVSAVAGTDTITGALTPAISAYQPGMTINLVPIGANTGAATLSLNGLTAKAIQKYNGTALSPNDLVTGEPAFLIYTTTGGGRWVLLNPQKVPTGNITGLGTLATQNGTFSGTHSGTSSGTNTGDQTITLGGDVSGSGTGSIGVTLTASQVLLRLTSVDGSGSGLDADLVDGQHASAFAASSHSHAETDITDGSLLARNGGNETITGSWTYNSRPKFTSAGGFLSMASSSNTGGSVIITNVTPTDISGMNSGDIKLVY